MAGRRSGTRSLYAHLLFLSLLSLSTTFSLSRSLHHPQTSSATATLDVAAAISATHRVVSLSSKSVAESLAESESSFESVSMVVELRSRETITESGHKDYRTLTETRLRRDADRVEALNARLGLALQGVKKSEMEPLVDTDRYETEKTGIAGPIVSGMSLGSGEYFSRIGVGRPAKRLFMVLDTGSDVTWVQCQPCSDCYQQSDPVFDPSASSSYSSLTCGSSQCQSLDVSACRNGSCLYQVSYGDGSYTMGNFATETLTLGPPSGPTVDSIAIGCGHDNEGLFVGAAGLLGLGGGALSFPSQLSAAQFSYCLVDRDSSSAGTLEFGASAAQTSSDACRAPLLRNRKMPTFYYVGLSGLDVGGKMLQIQPSAFSMDERGNGGVIVDSGTAVTRLPQAAYAALRDAFVSANPDLPRAAGVSLFDTCYDLSSRTSVDVSTVGMHFSSGESLQLPAKNYLVPVDSAGTFCFAFAPASSSLSIIGNVQQQGVRVSLNLADSAVTFSRNSC